MSELETELSSLLNKHSVENQSNTPDFILAEFLLGCLSVWNASTMRREQWYGRGPQFVAGAPLSNTELARIEAANASSATAQEP